MKQLNPYKYLNFRTYSLITTIVIILLLAFNCKGNEPALAKVIIKEVKGEFRVDTIKEQHTIYIPGKVENNTKLKNDIAELYKYKQQADQKLLDFENANDSLKNELFKNAISIKEFNQPFEDEYIKIDNFGYVSGTLNSLTTKYTIKEKTVDLPILKYRILFGGGLGINKDLNQGFYKVNLGYQNKKGNILRASYLNIGGSDFGMIERDFNLFSKW